MRHRRRKQRQASAAELNITAFMNLMVVLVPFLLITAVFSRLAILELNLPTAQSEVVTEQESPALALEITVRDDVIEVGDRHAGVLNRIARSSDDDAVDDGSLAELGQYLRELKRRFPAHVDATLLLEPDVPYDLLVQVMDAVRVADIPASDGRLAARAELFPQISIGDAPVH